MTPKNYIDVWETLVGVWEERVDEVDMRARIFDPLVRFLRARGWKVRQDPNVAKNYPSLKKWHRLARKGDLYGSLELHGRHLQFEMWQERFGVTNRHGGRYEIRKLRLMPLDLARRCRLEQTRIAEHLAALTGHPVDDRREDPRLPAEERLAREYAACGHLVPALGRPRWYSDDCRRSTDGVLLEQGQTAWWADSKGRLLRVQAFYSLNNNWFLKVGPRELTCDSAHRIYARQPADLRRRRNADLRQRRLKEELGKAIVALDFTRAARLKALLPAEAVRLSVSFVSDRRTA